jgi:hypothetical protein
MTTAKVKHSQEFIDLTDGQRFNWQSFMFTASHTGGHLPPQVAAGVRALVTP